MSYPNPKMKCWACKHSYMEPDGPARLICGEQGGFGKYINTSDELCGEGLPKFEQHPNRNEDGSLK